MTEVLHNRVLISAFLGWMVAQTMKVIISIIKTKKFDFERISGAGGMPSSHSCMVTALTISTAMSEGAGVGSPLFALSLVFSFVTLYDAMGVRWQAGLHARALNKYIQKVKELKKFSFSEMQGIAWSDDDDEEDEALKEFIGHKPMEVIVGVLLGIVIAMTVCLWP